MGHLPQKLRPLKLPHYTKHFHISTKAILVNNQHRQVQKKKENKDNERESTSQVNSTHGISELGTKKVESISASSSVEKLITSPI